VLRQHPRLYNSRHKRHTAAAPHFGTCKLAHAGTTRTFPCGAYDAGCASVLRCMSRVHGWSLLRKHRCLLEKELRIWFGELLLFV
jgi:hypothetical protein